MNKHNSIRSRIITFFALSSVIIAIIFSSFNLIFMWIVEDMAFAQILLAEKNNVLATYEHQGQFGESDHPAVSLILSQQELPSEIRSAWQTAGGEFFGKNGENYHLMKIHSAPDAYLLGEFSQQLIVTPVIHQVMLFLLMLTVILTLLSYGVGYYLANIAVRPISKLMTLLKSSSPEELPKNFSQEYPDNEIGFFATTLDQTLCRITEFIQREQNFTRDVSHELRTPVAVIKGVSELLMEKHNREPNPAITRLYFATLQMEQIITTLLSLAQEPKDLYQCSNFKVLPLVENCIIQHMKLIENKPVNIDMVIPHDATLNSHPVSAEILFANLISNALRHTDKGTISIEFVANCFTVTDQGAGIDQSVRDDLFEIGVKGPRSEGSGVGLSLVKRLCNILNIHLRITYNQHGTSVSLDFNSGKTNHQ